MTGVQTCALPICFPVTIEGLEEAEKKAAESEAQAVVDTIKSRAKNTPPKVSDKAKRIADALRKGKINRPGIFMATTPASLVWDAAIEATATTIEQGGKLADAIANGIQKIKESQWYQSLTQDQQKEAEDGFKDYYSKAEKAANKDVSFADENGSLIIPNKLIRELVEGGIDNINDLVAAIKEMVIDEFPNVTDRQIRDAVTKYGKVLNMSQDEISKQIRKIKNIGRYLSQLEDIAEKKRPLRSGLQRDKLSAEERALQKKVREEMKTLPEDEETASRELKTALDAIKTRLRNQIEELENEIATREQTVKEKRTVQDDAEAAALREQVKQLKELHDQVFADEIEQQQLKRLLDVTDRAIEKLQKQIAENDLAIKEKRVRTSPELEAKRQQRKALRDQMNQLREEAGILEKKRAEAAYKRMEKQIAELERRIREQDFAKKQPKPTPQSEELVKLRAKLIAVREKFDTEQYKNELKNRSKFEKFKDGLIVVWGIPRVLMATGEFSFILIQGGVPVLYNLVTKPKVVWDALVKMAKSMANEEKFHQYEQLVKAQEFYQVVKASKLALSEYDSKLTAREELGLSGWANTVWDWLMLPSKFVSKSAYEFLKGINPLKMIERGGVAFMNHIRLMQFLNGMKKLELQGKTFEKNSDDFKQLADVINTFSGRAKLPYNTEASAKALSLLFFSPRNWYSTIIQTTPLFFYYMNRWGGKDGSITKPSVAQKLAMSQYMTYMTITIGSVLAVAAYLNDDEDDDKGVSFDPRSTDFLKIKLGNTRVDPFGGRLQMVVYQTRILLDMMGKKSYVNSSGKVSRLGEGFNTPTAYDISATLLQNKLAPMTSQLFQYLQTKVKSDPVTGEVKRYTPYGKEYKFLDRVSESSQPIFWGTIRDLYKDQPQTVASFLSAVAALGVNISTYETKQKAIKERKKKKNGMEINLNLDLKPPKMTGF